MQTYSLGIDTGGTFTDGVLLDSAQQTVIKIAKVMTTHQDLRLCIGQVLDCLLAGEVDPGRVALVSLSTTLATNAIAEGKSRPVGLFLIGYDPQLVYKYDFHRQFAAEQFFFIAGGMDPTGRELTALDETSLAAQAGALQGQVEAFAVSCYNGTLNSAHEERAAALLTGLGSLPVVQGHHLTTRYNSIRRATTASLNAALLSTTFDFLNTVQAMLASRQVTCPLVVVRGDGSLVSADFAARRPVEIIHSGPATSAIGGFFLARAAGRPELSGALVIDIGGTTTDISLLQNGRAVLDGATATVGSYATSVRTIHARSFALGGDSHIRFTPRGGLPGTQIGPARVVPLAYLAAAHPEVKQDLLAYLAEAPEAFYGERVEYWQLRREPPRLFEDPRTNQVIDLLREGPRRMAWLLKQVGAVSPVQVDAARLVREDIITRAALTPTDLLHVTGEYAPWDAEAPARLLDELARMWRLSPEAVVAGLRQKMASRITVEVLAFLTGRPAPDLDAIEHNPDLGRWLLDQALAPSDPLLACRLKLGVPIVGIGAPARAFLAPVADALGAELIFPVHYQVANAVGTVVGSVIARVEGEVMPILSGSVITGYLGRAGGQQQRFDGYDEALEYTRQAAAQQARAEAVQAGAVDPAVELHEQQPMGGMVTLLARAVGKPGA